MTKLTLDRSRAPVALACLVAAAAGLCGCRGTTPARFYVLTPVAAAEAPGKDAGPGAAVLLGPVEIAGYLDRPQMVRRTGANRVDFAEFDRWAEPLKENIVRVLAADLAAALPGVRVVAFDRKTPGPAELRVAVDVARFDEAAGKLRLEAAWAVIGGVGPRTIGGRTTAVDVPLGEGEPHAAIAAAGSEALDRLAKEIAATIREVPPGTK